MPNITHNTNGSITISVTIPLKGSMMEMENTILNAVNDVGCVATGIALKRFDTDGSPIIREGIKLTSRNKDKNEVSNPFWRDRDRTPCLSILKRR